MLVCKRLAVVAGLGRKPSSSRTGGLGIYWVAIKELNLTYYIRETI